MTEVLYRKWRPQTWEQVVGQGHVVQTLRNAIAHERLSHAYLFAGPRGTGKTTTARLLAKAVNCLAESPKDRPDNECAFCQAITEGRFLDMIEIDAASNTSVDDVRDLRDRISFAPNEGRFKVYIVDEVHMLSTAAFNALLKTLEEPPPHAIFVLATTEVHKIPATVLSRCQRHEFRNLSVTQIIQYLGQQAEQEGFEVEEAALALIAQQATGSLRDAVSLLDQLVSIGDRVTLSRAREVLGTAEHEAVGQLVEAMSGAAIGSGLTLINRALDGGIDPRQLARQVMSYLRGVLLMKMGDSEAVLLEPEARAQMQDLAAELPLDRLLRAMRAFSEATRGQRSSWEPGLQLELAFLEAAAPVVEPDNPSRDSRPEASGAGEVQAASGSPRFPEAGGAAEPGEQEPEGIGPAPPESEPRDRSQAGGPADLPAGVEPEEKVPAGEESQKDSAEPSLSAGGEQGGFRSVLEAWPELMDRAYKSDPRAQALLNSCKPLGVAEGALVLGFQSDLLRDKMEKGHNIELVREALSEVLGSSLSVRCVLLQDWRGEAASTPPMQEDGMVATALRDLGAQVVNYEPSADVPGTETGQGEESA